mmetsp:Transcript_35663/g.107314  ORF Transcript_35663/g.107314 Transcript_35663/m.107314 type:complete len:215 (-) Transcript_35663:614-1258(-)
MRATVLVALAAVANAHWCRNSGQEDPLATVYYTAREPVDVRRLTTRDGRWPSRYRFEYHDDAALNASMAALDAPLAAAGAPGAYAAFRRLRPGAFRADLWRYAILWACGGTYVDAKMRIAADWDAFLAKAQDVFGFEFASGKPALVTCVDRMGHRPGGTQTSRCFRCRSGRVPELGSGPTERSGTAQAAARSTGRTPPSSGRVCSWRRRCTRCS